MTDVKYRFVIALVLGASGVAAGPYDGRYVPEGYDWDCQNIGMDGGALAVMDDQFFGVENTCALTKPVAVRDMDATLYDAICTGEGMTDSYRMMILKSEGGITVISRGFASRLKRCS